MPVVCVGRTKSGVATTRPDGVLISRRSVRLCGRSVSTCAPRTGGQRRATFENAKACSVALESGSQPVIVEGDARVSPAVSADVAAEFVRKFDWDLDSDRNTTC